MSIRLYVADTDETHLRNVTRIVSRCPDLQVIGAGANGAHTLKQLSVTPADVLLTEVQLPGLDGIQLTRDLKALPHPPAVVLCTRFYSPAVVSSAWDSGATYMLYKPLDYNRLPEILRECHWARLRLPARAGSRSVAEVARALLSEIGMPANLTGSMYLLEALSAAHDDPTLLNNLSKGLYVETAARTRSTPERLERALRNAIRITCERGSLAERFGHRPSNREFLMYMLDLLRRRLK